MLLVIGFSVRLVLEELCGIMNRGDKSMGAPPLADANELIEFAFQGSEMLGTIIF